MFKYYTNAEKRTTVAVLTREEDGKVFKGKSVCHPDDPFNIDTGEKMASYRAVVKSAEHDYRFYLRMLSKIDDLREKYDRKRALKLHQILKYQHLIDQLIAGE